MTYAGIAGVPDFRAETYAEKRSDYCLLIPVLNERGRLEPELLGAKAAGVHRLCDIMILDGGSDDGTADSALLTPLGVHTLLIKTGHGKQGAQLRMGFFYALQRGYRGILTVDGNNKDGIEAVPAFIEKLREGFGFVQGSRFLPGGKAENTPFLRYAAVRFLHAPLISLAAGQRFTDTTNAFRGYSREYLTHPDLQVFRDVFGGYELLAYLSVRATQLGFRATEVPVRRSYPKEGKTPTKISPVKGSANLLSVLLKAVTGKYNP